MQNYFSNPIDIATKILLEPAQLSQHELWQALRSVLAHKIDYADIYLQYLHGESWDLEDGIIKSGDFAIDQGLSVRAISGSKTGFAYADEINLAVLRETANAARNIAKHGGVAKTKLRGLPKPNFGLSLYPFNDPLLTMGEKEKVALLRKVDKEARKQDPRVKQVIASLHGIYEIILLLTSDNGIMADVRPLVRLNVAVIVEDGKKRERGMSGGGARKDYTMFLENDLALSYAREAVRLALLNLKAAPAPVGSMPVVLGAGWPAVLLHEAVGHGLEGDFIRKKSSIYTGKIGEKVAAKGCTIVDHGDLSGARRGSLHVDDEGTDTQCTVLIEDGILCGYMLDKLSAKLLGMSSTGNGRRESYVYSPVPRMTNTYMLNGNYNPEEIISSVKKGLYAVNFSGGQVDITSGEFVFTTSEAYLIENGKITAPVKHATLIGNGPAILPKITMIGNDTKLDEGVGTCGKEGQSVPVGVGQPTLKVSELVVGGG